MRVLGVDPGLSRCGLGVVDGDVHRAVIVRAGVVRTDPARPTARRLAHLHAEISALIIELRPDAVAIERVFINANRSTAMGVGQAAGVALLAAAQGGAHAVEYTPSQVKAAVTGSGDADKAQVGFMVRALLKLADTPSPPDVADALALGLCHLRQGALPTQGRGQDASPAADPGALGGAKAAPATDASKGSAAADRATQEGAVGGMSPRLAAAVAEAQPGAQVTRRRSPGGPGRPSTGERGGR